MKNSVYYEVKKFSVRVQNQDGTLKIVESATHDDMIHAEFVVPFNDKQEALDFMSNEELGYTYDEERLSGKYHGVMLSAIVLDEHEQLVRNFSVKKRIYNLAQMAEELGLKYQE